MIRKVLAAAAIAALLSLVPAAPAFAGQPGAECGDEGATSLPNGFQTGGFATAESNYAGSDDTHSLVSGNDAAVSQYDIACVHYTSARG